MKLSRQPVVRRSAIALLAALSIMTVQSGHCGVSPTMLRVQNRDESGTIGALRKTLRAQVPAWQQDRSHFSLAPKKPGQRWWYEPEAGAQEVDIPTSELVAVSATILTRPSWIQGECYEVYDRFRKCEPVDQVGYSILVFDRECMEPE